MMQDRVYFVTGATGFLAQEIVRLLCARDVGRVYCLIRGRTPEDATARLARLLGELGVPADDARVVAIQGDIEQERLGLDVAAYERLTHEVTHIVHAAADVRFDLPLDDARRVNVGGTERMLSFAAHCLAANRAFAHLDYVGTAYVAGRRRGIAGEDELSDRWGFRNTYEASKYEAESLVRRAASDLPCVIYRPSVILGASRTGYVPAFKSVYAIFRLFESWALPFTGARRRSHIDIVPVDWVAEALLAISEQPASRGHGFHLAAGPGRDLTMATLFAVLGKEFHKRVFLVPPTLYATVFIPLIGVLVRLRDPALYDHMRKMLVYWPYASEDTPQFAVTRTRQLLRESGLEPPSSEDHLRSCIGFAVASGFGSRRARGTRDLALA